MEATLRRIRRAGIPLVTTLAILGAGCAKSRNPPQASQSAQAPGDTVGSGAFAVMCFGCHGDVSNGNPAPPVSVRGSSATADVAVGAHQSHLRDGPLRSALSCSECHAVPASSDPLAHVDGKTATLTWGALAGARGVAASATTAVAPDGTRSLTCTNYCHAPSGAAAGSNHSPSWTRLDGTQASCGTCHAVPPPAPHPAVSGGAAGCAACHPGTVKADGSIDVAGGKHVNGVVDVGAGSGGGGAGLTCTSCHGTPGRAGADPNVAAAPPAGTRGETATTARAVGAHLKHLTDGPYRAAVACTECHVVPSQQVHGDGTVTLTWGNLAKAAGAAPAWNGSSCSSTYCHGSTLGAGGSNHVPSWTVVDGTQATCTTCHDAPPTTGGHPAVAGGLTACASCHPATVKADGTIDVAGGKHINGSIEISGQSCTSCHGDATRSPAAIAAAPPLGTHGETATTSRAVGAHQAHLVAGHVAGPVACTECHPVPAGLSGHPGGTIDVTFGPLATTGPTVPGWNGTSCSATYCHGATLGAGGSATAPLWTKVDGTQRQCTSCHDAPPPVASGHPSAGTALTGCAGCHPATMNADGTIDVAGGKHLNGRIEAATSCTSCHGDANRTPAALAPAPPRDTKGATSSDAVGAHLAHLQGGAIRSAIACNACHAVPADTTHVDGSVDFTWGALARTGGVVPSWTQTSLTCTNYCHGITLLGGTGTTPAWNGGASQAACGTCHGLPPTRAPGASQHPPVPNGVSDCHACHPATMSGSGSTIDISGGRHVDGTVDVDYTSAAFGCTTCHGDALRTLVAGADASARAAPPVGTHGETAGSTNAVGAHAAHLNRAGAIANPTSCTECHVVPSAMGHSNGVVEITFGALARSGGVNPSWTGSSCASTYCHGNFTGGAGTAPAAAVWTGPATTCTSCHANPPATPSSTRNLHGYHNTSSNGAVRATCANCHGTSYSTTTVRAADHVNGAKNVGGSGSKIQAWTRPSCTPTDPNGCHDTKSWQ